MSPSSTGKTLSLERLQQELQAAVAQIISDVDRSMAASETPVELNRSKILDEVRHAIVPDTYLVVSNNTETALAQTKALHAKVMAQLGGFARLPHEVRDIIFGFLVESGSVSILQASRQLAHEGAAHIFDSGICRMNFGFNGLTPTMRPSLELATRIQNVSIRVNTVFYHRFRNAPEGLDILELFTGAEISRKSCRVTFVNCLSSRRMVCDEILSILQKFTGFGDIVIDIKVEDWHVRVEGANVNESYLAVAKFYKRRAHRSVIDELKESLGSPYHGLDDEDYIGFHPLRARVQNDSDG